MERKELNETLFTKAFETQHNAFLNSASRFYWRSGNSKRCCLLSQR
ncbi:hypothetical protein [Leptospira noguchii]|nr:hypothetical protein [Leptospira noguchii]UOG52993.1 hypothetical protein MAL09_01820 [Leptospira noguchii]